MVDLPDVRFMVDDSALKAAAKELGKLGKAAVSAEKGTKTLEKGMEKTAKTTKDTTAQVKGLDRALSGYLSTALATFGAARIVRGIAGASQEYLRLSDRLRLVTQNTDEIRSAQSRLYTVAQQTRSSLVDTIDLYSRLARSTRELNLDQEVLAKVTETVNKAIKVSGVTAQASQTAIVQFGQGLASGALGGEELRSVLEQTPALAKALADGLGVTIAELRDMGAAQELTTEKIVASLLRQGESVDKEFTQISVKLTDVAAVLRNTFVDVVGNTDSLTDALESLSETITDKEFQDDFRNLLEIAVKVGEAFAVLGSATYLTGEMLGRLAGGLVAAKNAGGGLEGIAALEGAFDGAGESVDRLLERFDALLGNDTKDKINNNVKQPFDEAALAAGLLAGNTRATEEEFTTLVSAMQKTNLDLKRLNDAFEKGGETEYNRVKKLIDLEKTAIKNNVELQGKRFERLRQFAEEEAKLEDAYDKMVKRQKEAEDAAKELEDAFESLGQTIENSLADRLEQTQDFADEIDGMFESLGGSIENSLADAFEKALKDGEMSFDDFFTSVKASVTRLAAEMAAKLVMSPVMGGFGGMMGGFGGAMGVGGALFGSGATQLLGGVGGLGAIGTGVTYGAKAITAGASWAMGAGSGFVVPVSSMGGINAASQAAANGYGTVIVDGSGTYFQATPGVTAAAGAIGGFVGNYGANMVFQGGENASLAGNLGGTIGSFAGGVATGGNPIGVAIGSFLGNAISRATFSLAGGKEPSPPSIRGNLSYDPRGWYSASTQGVNVDYGTNYQMQDFLWSIKDAFRSVVEGIGGTFTGVGGTLVSADGGDSFTGRLNSAIRNAIEQGIVEVAPMLQRAVADTSSYEELDKAIGVFIEARDSLTETLKLMGDAANDNLSPFAQAMAALAAQFDQFEAQAIDLGVSLDLVTKAEERQIRLLREQRLEEVQSQIARLESANTSRAGGFFDNLLDPLRQAKFGFQTGDLSTLTQEQQLNVARTAFEDVRSRALTGEVGAIEDLPSIAEAFLQESRAFGASGSGFASDFNRVNQTLSSVIDTQEIQQAELGETLSINFNRTVQQQTEELKTELRKNNEQLEALRRELVEIQAA